MAYYIAHLICDFFAYCPSLSYYSYVVDVFFLFGKALPPCEDEDMDLILEKVELFRCEYL